MPLRTLDYILQAIAVLSLVTCGLITFFVFGSPLGDQPEAGRGPQSSAPSPGEKLPELRGALHQANQELKTGQARARELRQRIPDAPNEAEFLKQLSQVAGATGLGIRDYRRGNLAVKESYSELQITLTCSARYVELCRFLEELDQLPRILTIERLAITASDDGDEYPVDLKLSVYFRGKQQRSDQVKAPGNG